MYDANVLGAALGELGLELAWWPRNMDLKVGLPEMNLNSERVTFGPPQPRNAVPDDR